MTDEQENTTNDVQVQENPSEHRFEVLVDGTLAGLSQYLDVEVGDGDQRIFHHTEVFDEFGGQGLGGVLTREALLASAEAGHRVVPVCPFVKRWVVTHHDVDDSVDPVRPEHLDALR